MSSACVCGVVWERAHCVSNECCNPEQVVPFNGQLLIAGTVAGCFFFSTAEEGQVSAFVEGRQFFFLLSCLIFRTDNTS